MSIRTLQPSSHPVAAAVARVRAELSGVVGTPVWSLSAKESGEMLRELSAAMSQLDELTTRVLAQAETVETGADIGATSATNWWAHATRTTRAVAHRTARLGDGLDRHPSVRKALASGGLRTDQARVICDAVDALPDEVEAWVPPKATAFLLEQARDHDAKALRVLGRRLLEVIDPETADAEEARRLEAEEAKAREAASFTITDDGQGRCHGRFTLPSLHGQILKQHLTAVALSQAKQPKPADSNGDGESEEEALDRRAPLLGRQQLGRAFMTYLETRPEDSIPTSGGVAATVVVTMTIESLAGGLKAASLDTGGRISAGEARRLACQAGIIPVVLGGPSVVLDVGRRRRLHTQAQRIALGIRDKGCTADGCDAPPALCQAHHDHPWSRGGHTSVEQGRLLCSKHHHRIHDPAYQHTLDKHGKVRFTRRT